MCAFAHFRVCGGQHSDSLNSNSVSAKNAVETTSATDDTSLEKNTLDYNTDKTTSANTVNASAVKSSSKTSFSQEGVVTKTPTCTEPSEKTVTCSVCGYVQTGVVIEALEHTWADPEVEFVNNNTSARATWTCANDVTHKHTEECTVSKTEQPATCFARGKNSIYGHCHH